MELDGSKGDTGWRAGKVSESRQGEPPEQRGEGGREYLSLDI